MDKQIDLIKSVRLTFYHSLRYHSLYGLNDAVTKMVMDKKKLTSIGSIPGDIFASIAMTYQIFDEDYFNMAENFFKKVNRPELKEGV